MPFLKALCLLSPLALALVLTGCGMQGGTTVVKHESGALARVTDVTEAGTYALYDSYDTTPQVTVPLDKGDKIGFEDVDGKTVAIAGSKSYPLAGGNKTYFWKMK